MIEKGELFKVQIFKRVSKSSFFTPSVYAMAAVSSVLNIPKPIKDVAGGFSILMEHEFDPKTGEYNDMISTSLQGKPLNHWWKYAVLFKDTRSGKDLHPMHNYMDVGDFITCSQLHARHWK